MVCKPGDRNYYADTSLSPRRLTVQRTIFGPDHDAFRDAVQTFAQRSLTPAEETFRNSHLIHREAWLEAGKQGFLGLGVPVEYGGTEADDYRFNAILTEELARVNAALPSAFGIHFDAAAPYLVELTTEDQKRRWLPKFCAGEATAAIAMTEPSGGSDLGAIRTRADAHGSGWVINGSKTFITNGSSADLVITAARTTLERGSRGISLFVIEGGMPGFRRGSKLDKIGQPESDTAELFFEDVQVGREQLLGEVDRGFIHMMERLPQERIGAAVSNVAHASQIFRETIDYAKERTAFGSPIGSFQHNKFVLAELSTQLDVTQAYIDQCIVAHSERRLSSVDAARAKWWSAQVQNEVLDACVQMFGGYGFMREQRVARAWADARVTKIWAGSNEIMKEIIGRDLGL
jgi:alkylation response protein AidB-like acyl-CoA dehydrogenase